jgi:hypothetical protein
MKSSGKYRCRIDSATAVVGITASRFDGTFETAAGRTTAANPRHFRHPQECEILQCRQGLSWD